MQLVYTPKFCITIVSNFSWVLQSSQEKSKTMLCKILGGKQGALWSMWKWWIVHDGVACENIRFSSLFVAEDVSRGGTSATQRQKFHTDDVKSVQNPVRSADWSTEQLHCSSYCLRMTDKRQKATKVKCKREESLTKQSIFVEYSLL